MHQGRRTEEDVKPFSRGVPARKRTETACDSCKRRKVKCDGQKTGCDACAVNSLECSYNHETRRSRGPRYVAHLESKLRTLQHAEERRRLGGESPESPISDAAATSAESGVPSSLASAQCPSRDPLHQQERCAYEILNAAKTILDQMSSTSCAAKCAANCLAFLNCELQQASDISQPAYDFTLFESSSNYGSASAFFHGGDQHQGAIFDSNIGPPMRCDSSFETMWNQSIMFGSTPG